MVLASLNDSANSAVSLESKNVLILTIQFKKKIG